MLLLSVLGVPDFLLKSLLGLVSSDLLHVDLVLKLGDILPV